jgi:NAD(P)-dependent dehydrogenase (short-subunit alcohol dehydrogenase family)
MQALVRCGGHSERNEERDHRRAGQGRDGDRLALEWAPHHINVNVVAPGYIESEMSAGFENTPIGKKFLESLPRKRIGRPDELA